MHDMDTAHLPATASEERRAELIAAIPNKAILRGVKWIHYDPWRAAHLYFSIQTNQWKVLIKTNYLKPRCKRKTVLRIVSRNAFNTFREAEAWALLELQRRFGPR